MVYTKKVRNKSKRSESLFLCLIRLGFILLPEVKAHALDGKVVYFQIIKGRLLCFRGVIWGIFIVALAYATQNNIC